MSIFREIPPTASFPLHFRDFFSIGKSGSLEQDFRELLQVPYARVACSGTTSLYIILEAVKELSPKRTVIIPSFTCPAVAFALARANLKIKICDTLPNRFDYDVKQLEELSKGDDILAVLAMHLAGLAAEIEPLQRITKEQNIFLIEDCAQSLGAEIGAKKTGSIGDFSLFSMGRGKGLTIFEGGMITAAKKEYGELVDKKIKELVGKNYGKEFSNIIGLLGYGVFYRPLFFWFIYKLPRHYWKRRGNMFKAMAEEAMFDFPIHQVSNFRKKLGHSFFKNLSAEFAKQRVKAEFYFNNLKSDNFIILKELPNTKATYPYITLLFKNAKNREETLQKLDKLGLGPGIIYLHAIADYKYLAPYLEVGEYKNGRNFASNSMSISTNTYLTEKDLQTIVAVLNS